MNNNINQGINNTYERQGLNSTLDHSFDRQQGTLGSQGMNSSTSGQHPSTVNDIQQNNIPGEHRQYNANLSGIHPTTARDIGQEDTYSNVSSTPSEYGSDDTSHRSPHVGSQQQQQQQQRPVADRDAFIQEKDTQQYLQSSMNPAERAKELAQEMKSGKTRTASGDEKLLRIGDKKEIHLQ